MQTTFITTAKGQAMTSQQSEVLQRCKQNLHHRFLTHSMQDHTLVIYYRTQGGYFVEAKYSEGGLWDHSLYYQFWNETSQEPYGFLFSRPSGYKH